jgi:Transport protein Trs120 or TRAPPC9, TRAPP II complex subunit
MSVTAAATTATAGGEHIGFSKVPVNPSFRKAAVNGVAVVPLLSHGKTGDLTDTASARSFQELMTALRRHDRNNNSYIGSNNTSQMGTTTMNTTAANRTTSSGSSTQQQQPSHSSCDDNLVLVVPNSTLTRPGEWRYSETPLKSFHWAHGGQRLLLHDGRPQNSRIARDKLLNASSNDWMDLLPARRTAAVIGVLHLQDCSSRDASATLERALDELHQWTVRYSTPFYEATAHGRVVDRDRPIQRLFVYDSFDDASSSNAGSTCTLDLASTAAAKKMDPSSILAFPPSDEAHEQMMDLHLNVVLADLTVAIFCDLEHKIRGWNEIALSVQPQSTPQSNQSLARSALSRYMTGGIGDGSAAGGTSHDGGGGNAEEPSRSNSKNLGIGQMASLVSPDSKLAKDSPSSAGSLSRGNSFGGSFVSDSSLHSLSSPSVNNNSSSSSKLPQLMTPLDDDYAVTDMNQDPGTSQLAPKDADAIRKRDMGRREKYAADLCLLAGSPLDAYERYLKAAEVCKSGSLDPLWLASALEGCAAAHIAMAEMGGYG